MHRLQPPCQLAYQHHTVLQHFQAEMGDQCPGVFEAINYACYELSPPLRVVHTLLPKFSSNALSVIYTTKYQMNSKVA